MPLYKAVAHSADSERCHCRVQWVDASPKLPTAQIRDLAALRWLHNGESILLHGPVGVGTSHVAQALGHLAIR